MDENSIFSIFDKVCGPVSVYGSIICGIAVIAYYIFPKQRKFPNTVLVWTWYLLIITFFDNY